MCIYKIYVNFITYKLVWEVIHLLSENT